MDLKLLQSLFPIHIDFAEIVRDAEGLLKTLFPLCRSLTGKGNRETLKILAHEIPLEMREIASGTVCFDWQIPDEWHIQAAWIKNEQGETLVDLRHNNLHVVSYSVPIDQHMTFAELQDHLFTLPHLPEAIPYRTSYYKRNWGFCLAHRDLQKLNPHGRFHVYIDAKLFPGHLTYGELSLAGKSKRNYLFSTYICHPAMANDNLSGIVLSVLLAKILKRLDRRHHYKMIFVPETIGALAYCHENLAAVKQCDGGFVLSTVGGQGPLGFKKSFDSEHILNRAIACAFRDLNVEFIEYPFDIEGSDERQFSSQGFRVNMPSIHKDKYYEYPYYHTSLDNLDFVKGDAIVEVLQVYLYVIFILENDLKFKNRQPYGEVMLSRYGLYPETGGGLNQPGTVNVSHQEVRAMLWILFYSDGHTSLLTIAEKTKIPFHFLKSCCDHLLQHGLLEEPS